MTSVLIVDDEPGIRSFLQRGLQKYFGLVETAENAAAAEILHERCYFDLIIADIRLPGRTGVEWVTELREQGTATGVIFMTAYADLETAIAALRAGAEDFIMKPFRMEQMMASVKRYMDRQKMQRENFVLRRQVDHIFDKSGMVGECELIKNLCQVIKRVAPMPSTVLIEGESGTGKELAARAIHEWSGRVGSFVPVNCGAISAELLESELFGHIKGAFTGAHQAREGLFTYANEGTLFLDEIGEMPLSMQAHLLRVLEERTVRPVGSNKEVPVAVRIIAATNRDLSEQVKNGQFREDLYYRLNVLSIRMPSLRERLEDIPQLTAHFSKSLASELGVEPPQLSQADLACLRNYDWPGNVRELKNVIERCLLLNSSPSQCLSKPSLSDDPADSKSEGDALQLDQVEKHHILRVLEGEGGNKSAAARLLGISRKTLERKVQAWGEC
ncbi:MAG: sigma-54-dependent Fis family transcriptional regulator [Sedimenticola selenatireducens]|jgi:two-component system NtrC family response regulator|uniref:Sigma-54-dependent Fis family transcriptional regulator n=2 Tax=Sedimenticola selenatireducens TaxID=191960 RepID=A0A557S0M8_9GAMM|nr:sigma-54 dependent transcriptional regulator [Sedimenticola selenatireducens]TVO70990.1 sigma-54-dependent Fis family transcriptional regulator [Sedimenticola selenatireducens]TVT65856.1 MAG: sigma-54-dependent Fis family transcriptional regulator [Sedimenticola selenatireducens]